MDNVTHSIVGALTAEAALSWAPARWRPERRGVLHLAAILGNNLPDVDFAYTAITEGKLGYLLHHRGHTHTLLISLAMALVVGLGLALWLRAEARAANGAPDPSVSGGWRLESAWALALALLGAVLHLVLDFGNNYGIHPWWPWNNRWYYGDRVFIIEPLWLVSGLGVLLFLVRSKAMRVLVALGWCLSLGSSWLVPLPLIVKVLVTTVAVVSVGLGALRLRRGVLLATALGVWFGVYAVQLVTHAAVVRALERELGASPGFVVVDVVKTPIPAMPWCWDVIALGHSGDDYLVRLGRVSLASVLTVARDCPVIRDGTTAPRSVIDVAFAGGADSGIWEWEHREPLSKLVGLYAKSCWFRAFARFSRAPFVSGSPQVMGDFRYDRSETLEFAELELPMDQPCPRHVPPWVPPQIELLDNAAPNR